MQALEATQSSLMQLAVERQRDREVWGLMASSLQEGWFTWPEFPRAGEPLQVYYAPKTSGMLSSSAEEGIVLHAGFNDWMLGEAADIPMRPSDIKPEVSNHSPFVEYRLVGWT
jgi:hypothetical protein